MQHNAAPNKAQQFYSDLRLYQLCLVLKKIVEFKDFSRLLSDFPVLFKSDLISRTFQENPLNSSTFQACMNPEKLDEPAYQISVLLASTSSHGSDKSGLKRSFIRTLASHILNVWNKKRNAQNTIKPKSTLWSYYYGNLGFVTRSGVIVKLPSNKSWQKSELSRLHRLINNLCVVLPKTEIKSDFKRVFLQ